MADATQLNRLFPDTSLPSILPLPEPPENPEATVRYLKVLHHVLSDQQAKLVRSLNVLRAYTVSIDEDLTDNQPIGSGRINIQPSTGYAYYDAPVVGDNLSESDILAQAEWKPLRVEPSSFTLGMVSAPSFGYAFGMILEPVVAFGTYAGIDLGDTVVTRKIPPATTPPKIDPDDQPSDFLWTVEGDIVMADVSGFYS
jgi:hypothetical protein